MKLTLLAIAWFSGLTVIQAQEPNSTKMEPSFLRQFKLEDVKTNSLKLSKDTMAMYKLNILIKYGMLDELELLVMSDPKYFINRIVLDNESELDYSQIDSPVNFAIQREDLNAIRKITGLVEKGRPNDGFSNFTLCQIVSRYLHKKKNWKDPKNKRKIFDIVYECSERRVLHPETEIMALFKMGREDDPTGWYKGFNFQKAEDNNRDLVMNAARIGSYSFCKYMINIGAKVGNKDSDGKNAIDLAGEHLPYFPEDLKEKLKKLLKSALK